MTGPSVIIVSRHRPQALRRCLLALCLQDHPNFEVIVVCDSGSLAVAQDFSVKTLAFDEANISAARNAGLVQAAGEVVAFIDDDAAAEPTWLTRLIAPFDDPSVMASTGFVRGRNGISRQWGAAWVDQFGADEAFELNDHGANFDAQPGRAIKTQGTNCAFRRSALLVIGGFDPAYRFFHDETDVNLRMAARTAVVPLAQVVHGFAESERRRADRVPTSLFEIAASSAVFLRRHAPAANLETFRETARQAQIDRLADHARAGRIGTPDVWALLQDFDAGWIDGTSRPIGHLDPLVSLGSAFAPFPGTGMRSGIVLSARPWRSRAMKAKARDLAQQGQIVTLLNLSFTARPHWLQFSEDGYWLQEGGIFGRSARIGPRFQFSTLRRRVAAEMARWRPVRPVD